MSRSGEGEKIPKEILETAVDWLVRRDSHPLTSGEQRDFDNWMQADPLHRKAWAQTQNLWSDLDRLPEAAVPELDASSIIKECPRVTPNISSHKKAWMGTAALTVCLIFFFLYPGNQFLLQWTADSVTATGEIRMVSLPDGTQMHLNTASAIDLNYSDTRRTVRLLKGEAEFHVAHDTARPFVVEAAGGTATALGTAFAVRLQRGRATVTVLENQVEVAYPSGKEKGMETSILKPAEQASFGPHNGLEATREVNLTTVDTWRNGKLIFENKPLGEVIDELNRFHSGRIVVLGESLNRLSVNSVFPIDDPVKIVDALESSLNLQSRRFGDLVIFLYR